MAVGYHLVYVIVLESPNQHQHISCLDRLDRQTLSVVSSESSLSSLTGLSGDRTAASISADVHWSPWPPPRPPPAAAGRRAPPPRRRRLTAQCQSDGRRRWLPRRRPRPPSSPHASGTDGRCAARVTCSSECVTVPYGDGDQA